MLLEGYLKINTRTPRNDWTCIRIGCLREILQINQRNTPIIPPITKFKPSNYREDPPELRCLTSLKLSHSFIQLTSLNLDPPLLLLTRSLPSSQRQSLSAPKKNDSE